MLYSAGLTTGRILEVFTEEITAHRGRVTETFDDGRRLLTRSVLPHTDDVTPGDTLRGGVALKATHDGVWLYPYTFRLICWNGAIIAQTIESQHLSELHLLETDYALQSVREGVGACCAAGVFAHTVSRIRTASATAADLTLNLMPLLSRLHGSGSSETVARIIDQFYRAGDTSLYGLANAVTATARDTSDPELKWDLEEFGGGIAVGAPQSHPPRAGRAAATRPAPAMPVG